MPLARTQRDLTPFQRMVIVKEAERQKEKAEAQNGGGMAGGSGPVMNSKSPHVSGGTTMTGETVQYVNKGAQDG